MDNYCLDINLEYQKSKSIFFRWSLLFSIILSVVIISDVLLVALAGEDYQVNLIIAISITILFSWYAIYFFTTIYQEINGVYRYYKGYQSGLQSTDEVIVVEGLGEVEYVNGLYAYPFYVKYKTNLDGTDKIIYTTNKDLKISKDDKLTITTYRRILVKMEKHS